MSINRRMILAATLALLIVTGCKNSDSAPTPTTKLAQDINTTSTDMPVQPTNTLEPTETLPPTETRIPLPTKTRTPEEPTHTLRPTDSTSPTPIPTFNISQGEILFSVYPNGEIRSLNLDGRILETLVNPPSSMEINNDRHANWLPDGSEVSYTVDDFGQAEIWVMDDDGGNQRYLIGEVATDSSHAWSPDGNILAYVSVQNKITLFNLIDQTVTPLTDRDFRNESDPDWSPNGSYIAFTATDGGNQDIYIINMDGTDLTRVTNHQYVDQYPDWSPDGEKIAFSSTRDGDHIKDLFVIDLNLGIEENGNIPTQLTSDEDLNIDPDWSPDGLLIVYASHSFGASHATLFLTDVQGQRQIQLTAENTYHSPKWRPSTSSISEASGQAADPAKIHIPLRSSFELYSEQVKDTYKIYIGLPKGYDPSHPVGYHVIYLLDGDWYFDGSSTMIDDGGVVGIADLLNDGDRIPASIVVGIGYMDTNERGRDFHWRLEDFYAFLTDELIPLIDSEYHTNLNAPRTLIGHSSGAYFTLYAFLQFDETGTNPIGQFVAISGDYAKMGTFIFDEESRLSRLIGEGKTLASSLYMGVGKKDEARFVNSLEDMAMKLHSRSYQDFRLKSKVYGSEDHMSVVTPAVWAGLMWVFGE